MKKIINIQRYKKKDRQYLVCGVKLTISMMYQLLFLKQIEKADINYNTDYMKLEGLIKRGLVEMVASEEEIHHKLTLKGKAIIKDLLK